MAAKYLIIAQELEHRLRRGLAESQRLPTEAELCRQYGCSRQTVRSALGVLESKGLILRRQGSGSYPTQTASAASRQIAVVLADKEEYLAPLLLRDIRKAASDALYRVSCLETGGSRLREGELLTQLLRQRPAGILLEPITDVLGCFHRELLDKLRAVGIPLVYLGGRYDTESPAVLPDDAMGAGILLSRLSANGHRRMAAVLQWDASRGQERFRCISRSAGELGIRFSEENCLWYSRQERLRLLEGDESLLTRFCSAYRQDCSAVICFSDEIAYRLQRHLKSIHEPMSVLSFDNSYLAASSEGALTSLGFDQTSPGSAAVELLLDLIAGKPGTDRLLPWQLHIRKSG